MRKMKYKTLFGTLLLSFFTIYAVMFVTVDEARDIYLSLTRFYKSLLLVCPMAVILLVMMRKMFVNTKLNNAIIAAASFVFSFHWCF